MSERLSEILLGDMVARYVINEEKNVGLVLLPKGMPYPKETTKEQQVDGLIQLKLAGDIYNEAYAQGVSLRNGESVRRLRLVKQETVEQEGAIVITTTMQDSRGYEAVHVLTWEKGATYVRIYCSFLNQSDSDVELEMFESFSLSEISPYTRGDGAETLHLYRIRSVWSAEGRVEVLPIEDLQLEPAWAPHAVRCERFGQAGSMPVNRFFPFVAVEDRENQVFWGAQLAHPASWQLELYRKDDGLAISGGLADREFGHWMKRVRPQECFTTPEAIVTVANIRLNKKLGELSQLDILCNRMVNAAERGLAAVPDIEAKLPIVFNEYCTTWGNPSHENIKRIVDVIRDKGFSYFVIDCGWYKQEGIPWDKGMGDYEVSPILFPEGLDKTVNVIKAAGMVPGIWFEIENVAAAAKLYQNTEHLLKKDGYLLTTYFRRFLDMRDPWVIDYLTDRVIGTLKSYGFGYMKMDYNETMGIGCDGAESLGEGLRQYLDATVEFIEKVKREVPGIVLENCSSGGHRLEPSLMERVSMASFSDAHECSCIPVIAANLHRVIHPAQSQIWAVIRQSDSLERIAYSVSAAFLGRMCISGDVTALSKEQWDVIEHGMAFYKTIAPVIRNGRSFRWGNKIASINHPKGYQVLVRENEVHMLVVIHTFEGGYPQKLQFTLPEAASEVEDSFSKDGRAKLLVAGDSCQYMPKHDFEGVAFLLKKQICTEKR